MFLLFCVINEIMGYNNELNFKYDNDDLILPVLISFFLSLIFSGLVFANYFDNKIILCLALIIFLTGLYHQLFYKRSLKAEQFRTIDRKERLKAFNKKLKQFYSEGWLPEELPENKFGLSKELISPYGEITKIHKLHLKSKFEKHKIIKFTRAEWTSYWQHLFTIKYDEELKKNIDPLLFIPFIPPKNKISTVDILATPNLSLGSRFYDYSSDKYFNSDAQLVFEGNFDTFDKKRIVLKGGYVVKIEKNIWERKQI